MEKINYSADCPQCGKPGKFIPPTKTDPKRRKLIVKFKCVNEHIFIKEFDIK